MGRSFIRRALLLVVGNFLLVGSAAAQGVPKLDSYEGVAVRILQSNNAGTIQHVIDPAHDPEVTVLIAVCAVAAAVRVLVLAPVLFLEALVVPPDPAQHAGPWFAAVSYTHLTLPTISRV